MLGKIEGRRRREWKKMRWLDSITNFNGHEFVQTTRDSLGQGSLACCTPWGCKELDTTEQLNNNKNKRCLGIPASWFWRVSDVENCLEHAVLLGTPASWLCVCLMLRIISEHWLQLGIFASWFWCLSANEDHLFAWIATWAFLLTGSDIWLPLTTICEHRVSFGHLPNWFWDLITLRTVCVMEGFVSGSKPVTLRDSLW